MSEAQLKTQFISSPVFGGIKKLFDRLGMRKSAFNVLIFQATFFEVEKMIITTEQKFTVHFSPRTAVGNFATIDGIPLWSLSNEDVVEMEVAEGGMSAEFFAREIGQTMLTVIADADLSEGVRELTGVLDISVIGAEATTIILEPGPAELQ